MAEFRESQSEASLEDCRVQPTIIRVFTALMPLFITSDDNYEENHGKVLQYFSYEMREISSLSERATSNNDINDIQLMISSIVVKAEELDTLMSNMGLCDSVVWFLLDISLGLIAALTSVPAFLISLFTWLCIMDIRRLVVLICLQPYRETI